MDKSIILTGYSGTGKTTLVNLLNNNEEWKIISGGNTFREIAYSYNIKNMRLDIQTFSTSYFEKYGYEHFLNKILAQIDKNDKKVIFEGIRPLYIVKQIKIRIPETKIIFLNSNDNIITERLRNRNNYTNNEISKLRQHKLEQELNDIKKIADKVIYNNSSKEELKNNFYKAIEELYNTK